jgi:hypothetical protein
MPVKPSGAKGTKLPDLITGIVNTTNSVSAAILIATNAALTVALSLVPSTSRPVMMAAIDIAGRLMMPPSKGPRTSSRGTVIWKVFCTKPII